MICDPLMTEFTTILPGSCLPSAVIAKLQRDAEIPLPEELHDVLQLIL
jgi:hypothetical protein